MTDLWTALALVLVLEGVAYALFPDGMRRMMVRVASVPAPSLRVTGLAAAAIGVALVWMLRG